MEIEKTQQEIQTEQQQLQQLIKQRDELKDKLKTKRGLLFEIVSLLEDLDFDCNTLVNNEILPEGFK